MLTFLTSPRCWRWIKNTDLFLMKTGWFFFFLHSKIYPLHINITGPKIVNSLYIHIECSQFIIKQAILIKICKNYHIECWFSIIFSPMCGGLCLWLHSFLWDHWKWLIRVCVPFICWLRALWLYFLLWFLSLLWGFIQHLYIKNNDYHYCKSVFWIFQNILNRW